jgi:hypothetical protein
MSFWLSEAYRVIENRQARFGARAEVDAAKAQVNLQIAMDGLRVAPAHYNETGLFDHNAAQYADLARAARNAARAAHKAATARKVVSRGATSEMVDTWLARRYDSMSREIESYRTEADRLADSAASQLAAEGIGGWEGLEAHSRYLRLAYRQREYQYRTERARADIAKLLRERGQS